MRLHIGGKHINLKGYSDADWVGDVENHGSTSKYISLLEGGGIMTNNKQQPMVA